MSTMPPQPFKARVKNGRLILDEPTDLPEGEVVYLVTLDDSDELSDEERAALHRELELSMAELDAGESVDTEVILAKICARHA